MKYGNFLPLFTSSHAVITLFVSGLGPQLNTPILLTCGTRAVSASFNGHHQNTSASVGVHARVSFRGAFYASVREVSDFLFFNNAKHVFLFETKR